MIRITLSDTWVSLGTGKTFLTLKTTKRVTVFVGSAAPAANAPGLDITTLLPVSIPNITEMGGGIWVRGEGVLTYATNP
jgi:hypothetical protein